MVIGHCQRSPCHGAGDIDTLGLQLTDRSVCMVEGGWTVSEHQLDT